MWRGVPALLVAVLSLLVATGAHATVPARPQTTSLDSEAPPGAPPHWLPGERWVMQHWLPFDERRLYRLLRVDRGTIWRHLRDDTRNLAGLAEARGWDPGELATALAEPWEGKLREPARLAVLRRRALRVLTQGHLSQHMLFHSLHQDAIPDNAPAIFGVGSRAEFAALRRSELSPLMICRLNGRSRGHAQQTATETLTAMAELGVEGQAIPARQAERLLARQLSQLPRWLQQTRYNGPPPLKQPRSSAATAANYSNNADLSGDGRTVVFEAYDAKLARVKQKGEIGVVARVREGAAPRQVTGPPWLGVQSMYNPAVSADGRWLAAETAEGNLNFAKRYGQIGVVLHDLRSGGAERVSHPAGLRASRSAYNPTLSGTGRLVAFEAYDRPERRGARSRLYVHDRRTGRESAVPTPGGTRADAYEPRLSADGRHLAFTVLARSAGARSEVFVRDLAGRRTRQVSSPGEEAWEPVLSASGGTIAYTAMAAGSRSSRVVVRRSGGSGGATVVAPRAAAASEPSLSGDGRSVAFTARADGGGRSQVYLHELRSGRTTLVSRATGSDGGSGLGSAGHPAISGDGRRVGFTSDSWNLSPAKCNSARGVFVRDVRDHRTTQVSVGDGQNRGAGPTKGSGSGFDFLAELACA